ncbi:MAG: TatD family deoxyribonuclease [Sphingobacteriales bacterium]|nr:MAG: TatD family deoxyribonuclease [Sphingobacteriales bacterium]TAF78571.1 MAG: TatD family deoxyribonuclease [Sphingobacteriales bacterium]
MILTDTHTHIYYLHNEEELQASINLCIDNKVNRLFLPCVDVASVAMIQRVCAAYPEMCFAMLGLHPCDVKNDYMQQLQQLKQVFDIVKPCAIGEIGIDLYWDKNFIKQQQEAFNLQIAWAKASHLPINIHCRDAFEEVFEVLEGHKGEGLRGILHCFTGNIQQAERAINLGLYIGIGGVVTYKNAGLDKVVTQLNLENLVLETDAPYLAPVPYRGKPNQSAYLVQVAQKIADLKLITIDEVAEITTLNSRKVFGI